MRRFSHSISLNQPEAWDHLAWKRLLHPVHKCRLGRRFDDCVAKLAISRGEGTPALRLLRCFRAERTTWFAPGKCNRLYCLIALNSLLVPASLSSVTTARLLPSGDSVMRWTILTLPSRLSVSSSVLSSTRFTETVFAPGSP
jgi:hypothetical protein